MHRVIAGVALLLMSCGVPAPEGTGYRNNGHPIASAALFDAARFEGVWHVVAAYGPEAGCGPLDEEWQIDGPGRFVVRGTRCTASGVRGFAERAVMTGPGRALRGAGRDREEIWVMWVDADYRIAAIGTPNGQFGRILSRSAPPRADLLKAATEIMEFNGYDISGLEMVPKPIPSPE